MYKRNFETDLFFVRRNNVLFVYSVANTTFYLKFTRTKNEIHTYTSLSADYSTVLKKNRWVLLR